LSNDWETKIQQRVETPKGAGVPVKLETIEGKGGKEGTGKNSGVAGR